MSKILDATCSSTGVVSVGGVAVDAAEVLSEGKQSSSGILILDRGKAWYIPSSATDIKTTIEKLITVIDKVSDAITKTGTIFTSVGAGMTGPTTAPPPTLAADVVVLNGKVTDLAAVKADLNTLKGALK